jgi:hypothetical protein
MLRSKIVAALLMASAVALEAPAMAAPVTPLSVAAKPQPAESNVVRARFGGWGWHGGGWGWGLGAALAGAAIGAAVTAPYYGGYDPYGGGYPAYGYGGGYPAYGYGYPAYGYAAVPAYTVVRPYWRHYGWYHRPYWRGSYAWGW